MNDFNQIAQWLQWNDDGTYEPRCKVFPVGELGIALKFTESLRKAKHTGEAVRDDETGEMYVTNVSHITISGDVLGNATKPGCDVTDSTYDWKKRRK